jgi:uncharacterized membrane protein YeaQ/YmgE (transglycosylase-associated protein family)
MLFHLIGIVVIGFIAGIIARIISPSPNNPQGFILTSLLGIFGAAVANFLGRALHLFGPYHSVHLLGSVVGAVIVLAIWHWFSRQNSSML